MSELDTETPTPSRKLGRPRKDQKRDTRQVILETAFDLFAAKGFSATSIREIAVAVGVRESALYSHFPSKDAILDTILSTWGPDRITEFVDTLPADCSQDELRKHFENTIYRLVDNWMNPNEKKIARITLLECLSKGEKVNYPFSRIHRSKDRMVNFFHRILPPDLVKTFGMDHLVAEFMGPLLMFRHEHFIFGTTPPTPEDARRFVQQHLKFFYSRTGIST